MMKELPQPESLESHTLWINPNALLEVLQFLQRRVRTEKSLTESELKSIAAFANACEKHTDLFVAETARKIVRKIMAGEDEWF